MSSPWHPDTWPRRKRKRRGCGMALLLVLSALLKPRRDHRDDGCLFVLVLLVGVPLLAAVITAAATW